MKVTVGVPIDSLAVNVNVTLSSVVAVAYVVSIELSEAMLTLDNVGATVSTTLTVLVTVVAALLEASETLYVTA